MDLQGLTKALHRKTESNIVLLVADGLGGLPMETGGQSELECAQTPNLDELARQGTTGLMHPVLPGITCGSGPGHLALFGYDPLRYRVGRGVLSALGVEFELQDGDVAARGNFCSIDKDGDISDRRAGRISDEQGKRLVDKLRQIELNDVEVLVEHVKEYRFAVVLRGSGLGDKISDTDPHVTGVAPREPAAADRGSEKTAQLYTQFIGRAREILADETPANMILLRGFSARPDIPSMREAYGLEACAIATYPMYRGLSRLLGMDVPVAANLSQQMGQMAESWDFHDYFFLHYKDTDSAGEDGDFDHKVQCLDWLDSQIPLIVEQKPDVLVVTGDHSTPSCLRSHSWHPVPVLLWAKTCRPDRVERFGERDALCGGLGHFEAQYLMPLALAHAGKLDKFGA
ncbi:MAG: 2,3-bisphosphoglycerate-independent phosphoglycerate mutase [Pirellulaceae bacterium]